MFRVTTSSTLAGFTALFIVQSDSLVSSHEQMFKSTLLSILVKARVVHEYGILTKCEVIKMAGYWQSSFFCVFMDRDEVEVHKLAKKRTRPISSHLDRTSLVNKGFIIWLSGKFFSRDTAGNPEWERQLHLARPST